ncbi:hypothetical protein EDD15DRAFT_2360425 [Pisolithus albus]|nr:hypothetical protein EDD15DRAFT_2360425 [Pisolithus albus]
MALQPAAPHPPAPPPSPVPPSPPLLQLALPAPAPPPAPHGADGQIHLPPWPEPPVELKGLFCGTDNLSNNFRKNSWSLNSAFAFTSLAVDVDETVTNTSGPYCFKIHGQLHHKMGALEP